MGSSALKGQRIATIGNGLHVRESAATSRPVFRSSRIETTLLLEQIRAERRVSEMLAASKSKALASQKIEPREVVRSVPQTEGQMVRALEISLAAAKALGGGR